MLLAENITEDNYNTVVAQLNMLASTSVAAIEEQTSENLNRITTAFNSLADLLAEDTSTLIVEDNVSACKARVITAVKLPSIHKFYGAFNL